MSTRHKKNNSSTSVDLDGDTGKKLLDLSVYKALFVVVSITDRIKLLNAVKFLYCSPYV